MNDFAEKPPDPVDLAIERAADGIERNIGKLGLVHRLEVEFQLRRLVDEINRREFVPW
jgi:hypothetical protein